MENQGARSQFGGGSQFKDNSRSSNEATSAAITDTIVRGKDAVGAAAKDAMNSAGSDLQSLQADLNGLKETVTKFMSEAADQAAKTASQVTSRVSDVAGDLADRGSAMASTATEQAKTFASEVESMARRNPMGAIAGAVLVGIMIGVLGRRS
jgi:ElaB/YqjD/DUF883 family membrane-anchored ribosome-binding protein